MEHACLVCTLWFHQDCPWCLPWLGPSQRLCPALSAEVNLSPSRRRRHLLITTPCRQPDLVTSSTVVTGWHSGGSGLTLFKGFSQKMRVARELLRGLGDTGPSLPSWLGLSPANLLYREDFPQSTHGVGVTLFQSG